MTNWEERAVGAALAELLDLLVAGEVVELVELAEPLLERGARAEVSGLRLGQHGQHLAHVLLKDRPGRHHQRAGDLRGLRAARMHLQPVGGLQCPWCF